jgi:hypothetical protein
VAGRQARVWRFSDMSDFRQTRSLPPATIVV